MGQQVYDRIAKALLTGQMRPNDKLTIRGLADQLGVSSTPVRDAVKQLTHEQVLEMRSPKDVRVPVLTRRSYLEILDIRLLLEGLAAERAAQEATPAHIKDLQRLLNRNDKALAKRNWGDATEGNQDFHLALSEIAGMPHLQKILRGLWLQMGPLVACYYDTAPPDLNVHHAELVAALIARDSAAARRAMQCDIASAKDALLVQIDALRAQHFSGVAA
ncbi:GntR family transcriptional regulator [Marivita sp. S6314]|uniref:GntR family transcriptional regulator n=1 Tax=Marivita sp. S6314 TaxID=2926406 RepID=UPI001FF45171|nr:GntR family transcriptional regulator [Marivita sp. S6314]MCK0150165.1 GntR family transcriptional regulator [Marivita sp. S6314]